MQAEALSRQYLQVLMATVAVNELQSQLQTTTIKGYT